jgi:hypothetical protein
MENLIKEEREKINEQEKINLINKEKSKKLRKKVIFYLITFLLIISFIYIGVRNASKPGKYDDFAKCLTEEGFVEYGAFWCSNCAEQKKLFGKSFEFINYIECDPRGNNAKPELCQKEKITRYPTWIINNTKLEEVTSLERLAEKSGCILNS